MLTSKATPGLERPALAWRRWSSHRGWRWVWGLAAAAGIGLLGVLAASPGRPLGDDPFAAAPEPGFCAPFWKRSEQDRRSAASLADEARRHPRRPELWIALSLAYLRASVDQPDLVLQALEAAERALELSPANPRAAYLRAVILQSLGLRIEAKRAIDALLRGDPSPAVRKAIAPCLEAVERPTEEERWRLALPGLSSRGAGYRDPGLVQAVDSSRQSARLYGEQTLLPLWAKATLGGEALRASQYIEQARAIGEALSGLNGDRLLSDSVHAVEVSSAATGKVEAMARGLVELDAGRKAFERFDTATAEPRFEAATALLRKADSPMALWSQYYLAYCRFLRQGAGFEEALDRLRGLGADLQLTGYLSLTGRIHRLAGTIHSVRSRPAEAVVEQSRAVQVFRRLGERDNWAGAEIRLAIACDLMGRAEEAWRHRVLALRGIADLSDRTVVAVILDDATKALAGSKSEIAILAVGEALARTTGSDPVLRAGLERRKAALLLKMGQMAPAEAAMRRSRMEVERMPVDKVRRNTELEIMPTEIALLAQRDERGAITLLNEALRRVEASEYRYFLSRLLLQRGLLWQRLGANDRALADFERGIAEREREAVGVGDALDRSSFLDLNTDLFKVAIDLQLEAGNSTRALELKERSRARLLKERWSTADGTSSWPGGEELRRFRAPTLGEGDAVVEFHLGRGGISIWIFRQGTLDRIVSPVAVSRVEEDVESLRKSLAPGGRGHDFEEASSALYDALLAPATRHLKGVSRLVVIPDSFLWRVPFSALLNRRSDRLTVQDWDISVAPSAFQRPALPRSRASAGSRAGRAFLVGAGEPNREKYPWLARLTEVGSELQAVAPLYPGALVLTGEAATRAAFLKGVEGAEVVYFAGHALWNERSPALSTLLFAEGESGGEPGEVYLYELLGLDLSAAKLVVLGGCSTGVVDGLRTEGALSLSLPFLVRGAGAVLGSLWRVEDQPAARFLVEVHRQYITGVGAAKAVAQAKRRFLANSTRKIEAVRLWAPFELSTLVEAPQ